MACCGLIRIRIAHRNIVREYLENQIAKLIKVHCRYGSSSSSSCFHWKFNWWHRTVPWKKRGDAWKSMAYPGHDDAIFFAIVWHLLYDLWLSDWRSTCLGFRYASVFVSTTSCNHTQKSCRSGKQQQNLFKPICQTVLEPFKPFEVKINQGPLPIRQPLLPLLESLEMQLVASHRSLEEAGRLLWEWRSSCFGPRYALVFASTSFMIFQYPEVLQKLKRLFLFQLNLFPAEEVLDRKHLVFT